MKNKILLLSCFIFFALSLIFTPGFAQLIEFGTDQMITVDHTGFYPFSSEANSEFMNSLNDGTKFNVEIFDFGDDDKPFRLAPAADNREIGRLQKVKGDRIFVLDFKKAKKRNLAGLSFRRGKGPSTIGINVSQVGKGNCSKPVSCDTDCIDKSGKCCEANSDGNAVKWCNPTGVGNACGCINKRN